MSLPKLDVPQLLHQYGLHPKKSLGQNFLLDEAALGQVVAAAQLSSQDDILEIGAGLGSLTRQLAITAHSVVAVEVDPRLIPALNQVLDQFDNVRVLQGDILCLDPGMLFPSSAYLVVANIPYNITSALIRHLLESHNPPRRLVLTLQQEVAERICASPGKLSLLALSVQVYGQPEIVARIPASAFYPAPKVDSAVLRVELFNTPLIPAAELEEYFRLVKAGFSQKRKTLRNALAGGLHLSPSSVETLLVDAGIDPKRRAETLSLPEWHRLTSIYKHVQATD